jgi:hypothetical protein
MKRLLTEIWRFFLDGAGPATKHYEIGVPDQSEIVYRDQTTAIIRRGGEA